MNPYSYITYITIRFLNLHEHYHLLCCYHQLHNVNSYFHDEFMCPSILVWNQVQRNGHKSLKLEAASLCNKTNVSERDI